MHLRKILTQDLLLKEYSEFEDVLNELGFMITVQDEVYSQHLSKRVKFVTFIYEHDVFWQAKGVVSLHSNGKFDLYLENFNLHTISNLQISAV